MGTDDPTADDERLNPMMSIIRAPWTPEQVDALNRFQRCAIVHPFTCPNQHDGGGDRDLVATRAGWICCHCDYRQEWAHRVMLQEPPDPRDVLAQKLGAA